MHQASPARVRHSMKPLPASMNAVIFILLVSSYPLSMPYPYDPSQVIAAGGFSTPNKGGFVTNARFAPNYGDKRNMAN